MRKRERDLKKLAAEYGRELVHKRGHLLLVDPAGKKAAITVSGTPKSSGDSLKAVRKDLERYD